MPNILVCVYLTREDRDLYKLYQDEINPRAKDYIKRLVAKVKVQHNEAFPDNDEVKSSEEERNEN